MTLLAGAVVLVPAEQASLYTTDSLNKHGAMGAWFAAIAAGYAADKLIVVAPAGNMRAVTCGACVVALSFPAVLGAYQARAFSTSWPNSSAFVTILGPLVDHSTGRLLVEDPSIAEYYLPAGTQWERWSSTRNIIGPEGEPTGGPSTQSGHRRRRETQAPSPCTSKRATFPLIALNFGDTTSLDGVHRRRPSPEPSLPPHPGRALRIGDPPDRPGLLRDLAIRAAVVSGPAGSRYRNHRWVSFRRGQPRGAAPPGPPGSSG